MHLAVSDLKTGRIVALSSQLPVASAQKRARKPGKELPVPTDLKKALAANAKAAATFKGFAPSHRTAYLDWISDAKQPATRAKRIGTTLSWLAEGKPQNWKYREPRAKT